MTRTLPFEHRFVAFIPDELDEGVLYISLEYNTTAHLCFSGCGQRVTATLHPSRWALQYDGETVSLSPSIGNGSLDCNSHYFLRRGQVFSAKPLSPQAIGMSLERDRLAAAEHALTLAPAPRQAQVRRRAWLDWCTLGKLRRRPRNRRP